MIVTKPSLANLLMASLMGVLLIPKDLAISVNINFEFGAKSPQIIACFKM